MESAKLLGSFEPNEKFIKKVEKGLASEKRDKLPDRWNFHKQIVYLTPQQKKALQISLSKMDKQQIKKQIKTLTAMEKEKLTESKLLKRNGMVEEELYQTAWKWAFYCREAAKFADFYLRSLEYQKKV